MSTNWLIAYGDRTIPQAFIINQEGKVAWIGMPMNLDKILPLVIANLGHQ